jgi:hypothetical protein
MLSSYDVFVFLASFPGDLWHSRSHSTERNRGVENTILIHAHDRWFKPGITT